MKNVGNQTVDGSYWHPYSDKNIMEVWFPTFFKISYFVFNTINKLIQCLEQVHDYIIFIFGWTFPFNMQRNKLAVTVNLKTKWYESIIIISYTFFPSNHLSGKIGLNLYLKTQY